MPAEAWWLVVKMKRCKTGPMKPGLLSFTTALVSTVAFGVVLLPGALEKSLLEKGW